MRLGREVQDGVGLLTREDARDAVGVADVELVEAVVRAVGDRRQRGQIGGIRQLVDVGDGMAHITDQQSANGGTDESGAAGDE